MSDKPELSEAKRALLEKYLRGDRPQAKMAANVVMQRAETVAAGQRESIVAIQTRGSKRPFFFLHGDWINHAYWCFSLAHYLGSDQPFYALEPYSFDGLLVPPTLEAIAAAHLKSLRAIQPEGPYLLGGFCNGGLLAYEMARQLHTEGQTLDLLVLMDPMGLIFPARHRWARAIISRIGDLMRLGQEKQLNGYILLRHVYSYLQSSHYRELKDPERREIGEEIAPGHRDGKMGFALPRLASIFPTVETLRKDYSAIYDWAAMRYVPLGLYPGKITFFWDSQWASQERSRRMGWRKVTETNEIETYVLPGTQMETRTTYLHVLAEHLSECLSKAQKEVT